jgi:hypothetical protein
MKHIHVINLGGGVQSTTMHLMAKEGLLLDASGKIIQIDFSIFGDTGEEPIDLGENVYDHLTWLADQGGPKILIGSAGKLGDHLKHGTNSTGQRFASIPAFTLNPNGKVGKVRRQCTKEYKIEVVERVIRRQILGLKPRQRIPKDVMIHQYMGISLDESGRMFRAKTRELENKTKWATFHYPLIEQFGWTRAQCREYLKNRVPHRVPRSACVFCPFHSDEEWNKIKLRGGKDWQRVVEIDHALRIPGNVVNRGMDAKMFLHRSCKPIDEIVFDVAGSEKDMAGECQGMCGH